MRRPLLPARIPSAVALLVVTACSAGSHPAPTVRGLPSPSASSASTPAPSPAPPSSAPPTPPLPTAPLTAAAFGMHYFGFGVHPYPPLPFGTARVWDTGMTWKDLQPTPSASLTSNGNPALARLDAYIRTLTAHGAEPLLTLGMTPAWAAHACRHVLGGIDWGVQTCAPSDTGMTGPWATYVRALAKRYRGTVRYFELWNEPNLRNGYNDSVETLAKLQATAYKILHRYGDRLVSPSVPFTAGGPAYADEWMDRFFHEPGGKDFDVVGLHLYPSDSAVRRGFGPEWVVDVALAGARQVLESNGLAARPIWNTETNVGRAPAHTVLGGGDAAAAVVARTFILDSDNQVARTIWYGADERSWGGTWLENADYAGLSTAGVAYARMRSLVIGKAPLGCAVNPPAAVTADYVCRFASRDGRTVLAAVWTTGPSHTLRIPVGTRRAMTVTGNRLPTLAGTEIVVSHAPIYLIGSFR